MSALASLDTDPEPRADKQLPGDRGTETLRPALVILGLGVLQQLSGQAVTTFYASQIFQVGRQFLLELDITAYASTQEAGLGLPPEDCALILGLTHLLSSLLSLVVRQLVGRRPLLLVSQVELETKVKRRFAKVSLVSYSRPSLMIISVGVPISHLLNLGSTSV